MSLFNSQLFYLFLFVCFLFFETEQTKVPLQNRKQEYNLKLDVIMRKQDDIIHMQDDILMMQHTLVHEVSSRIDNLMELSIKMQESQVSKLVYLSEIGRKKLLTCFIPGLQEFQLHLLCESRNGIHEVINQCFWLLAKMKWWRHTFFVN
jgi:hypothetical protein